MLDKEHFSKTLKLLIANFSINPGVENIHACYELIKNQLTNQEFSLAVINLITTEAKLYGLPTFKMWMEAAGKRALTIEEEALLEVNRLVNFSQTYFGTEMLTDNPILNQTLHDYGGIAKLCWDLNEDNDKKKEIFWVKKELQKIYTVNKIANRGSMAKSVKVPPRYDYKRRQINVTSLGLLGDENKIEQLICLDWAQGEQRPQETRTSKLLEDLGNRLKKTKSNIIFGALHGEEKI